MEFFVKIEGGSVSKPSFSRYSNLIFCAMPEIGYTICSYCLYRTPSVPITVSPLAPLRLSPPQTAGLGLVPPLEYPLVQVAPSWWPKSAPLGQVSPLGHPTLGNALSEWPLVQESWSKWPLRSSLKGALSGQLSPSECPLGSVVPIRVPSKSVVPIGIPS